MMIERTHICGVAGRPSTWTASRADLELLSCYCVNTQSRGDAHIMRACGAGCACHVMYKQHCCRGESTEVRLCRRPAPRRSVTPRPNAPVSRGRGQVEMVT